jgi:universal stress protein A
MFQQLPVQEDNIVAFRVSGKLSHADYQEFLPRLESLIRKNHRISILLELVDFHGWDLAAAWDDFRFGIEHANDFERLAIVGHGSIQRWMSLMARPFTSAKVQFFEQDQLARAWDWLREPDRQEARDQSQPPPYRRILVGVDFSPHSVRAVRRALDLAEHTGGQVTLVHAVDNSFVYDQAYDPLMAPDLDLDQQLIEAAKTRMKQMIDDFDAENLRGEVLLGAPKGVLVSQAEALHTDLLIVGTHGYRGLSRLLGSTASALTHSARCDVLTVRIDDPA